jgi:4-alpha-glucanotransferase
VSPEPVNLDAWSIVEGYHDAAGTWHPTSQETRAALRTAMGARHWGAPPAAPPLWFVRSGSAPGLQGPCDVYCEDGTLMTNLRSLPPDLPNGYHVLRPLDGGPATRLVVHPPAAPVPDRRWGWAAQLYAARSRASWGIGDLADLRHLAGWSRDLGAEALVLSPLHATAPSIPQQDSPYFATSRIFRNPLYLRIEDIPGAADADAGVQLHELAAQGRALNAHRRIDRDAVFRLKSEALAVLFARFQAGAPAEDRRAFERHLRTEGRLLHRFATFCALVEVHGAGWQAWPSAFRHPLSTEVSAFAAEHHERVRYHSWVQWHLDRQLSAAAAEGVDLIGDLAVGFEGGGADGWMFQDTLALSCKVGAPPDEFNADGQDWGLPPFIPWKLRASHYEPFLATIRAAFRHMGGVRIDHVMGLFRLYWIHESLPASQGTYVHYDPNELLGLVALEADRAGAFVIGEDLGTVTAGVRETLADAGVLSYRLVYFEDAPPSAFPERALAAITTHDLPTVAGVWTGADLEAQRSIGRTVSESGDDHLRSRIAAVSGAEPGASVHDVVVAAHRALAEAPCLVVAATLDDALGVEERPNMPGTVDEWPNWRIALPIPIEAMTTHPTVLAVAEVLNQRGALGAGPDRSGPEGGSTP